MSNAMTNPFENELPTVESLGMPATMTPMDAIKFAKYIIDVLGHRGPMGPEEWIKYGDLWKEQYAQTGGDNTGIENDDSVLGGYADVIASTGTGTETTPGGPANNETIEEITGTGTETGTDTIDEITVVEKFPENPTEGMQVIKDGIKYVWSVWGLGDGWEAIPDESPGTPADNETIEEITVTGTQPDSMSSGIDWSSILSGIGGIAGLGSLLGWEGLGGGDEELSWFEKLFEIVKSKKAIDDYNKYKVPTGQMAAQSAIGKQWGLPSKESMVMQGLGPNILQGQKYAMPKGTTMPAATHVSGMPLLEEIEGGNQGGIMGLKSHGDITPAFLEPGEFVFTKKATDNIGAKRLYKLMKQAEQMGIG